jgi:hypothetical protein
MNKKDRQIQRRSINRLQDCFDDDDVAEGPLFQGIRHDPSVPLVDFAPRDHIPAFKAWMQDEPCGCVHGMNHYIVERDNSIHAVNPLRT